MEKILDDSKIVELATKLAHDRLVQKYQYIASVIDVDEYIFVDTNVDELIYVDDAQMEFNEYYDYYYNQIINR